MQVEPGISTADQEARQNWLRNRAAVEQTQPRLAERLGSMPWQVEWVLGRDGSLTAMLGGKWWSGCSVPMAAGKALLAPLESSNLHHCFLGPAHSGLLRAARSRLGDDPALLSIVPDWTALTILLGSYDFSSWIAAKKFWLVGGDSWQADLRQLFEEEPGLSTPGKFIRTKLMSDEQVNPMIAQAQAVFSAVSIERTARIQTLLNQRECCEPGRILLAAGSAFRMWDEAGHVLVDELTAAGANFQRYDCDDPASSSPLGLAMAASGCEAIVAANASRQEAPNLVSMGKPWITWMTRANIPQAASAGPYDVLLLADAAWRSLAQSAGWPMSRVAVAPWPTLRFADAADSNPPTLAIVADTQTIRIPKSIEDLSSHSLLWERLEIELRHDPLAVGEDVGAYIEKEAKSMGIAAELIDRRGFGEGLILPAYQQGLARLLLKAGIPLRLHGRGWEELDEFRYTASGAVKTREEFYRAIGNARALVDPWLTRAGLGWLGKPIVRPTGRRSESLIRDAKLALTGSMQPRASSAGANLAETILNFVRHIAADRATIAAA